MTRQTAHSQIKGFVATIKKCACPMRVRQVQSIPFVVLFSLLSYFNIETARTVAQDLRSADSKSPTIIVKSPSAQQIFPGSTLEVPLIVTTNTNATCRFKNTDDEYDGMWPFTTTGRLSHATSISYTIASGGQNFTYYVRCRDTDGNTSASQSVTITIEPGPADTTAPTPPTHLAATGKSSSQVDLSWTASEDNVGVTSYQLFRSGSLIGTPQGTSYSDKGLVPETNYTYSLRAIDAAGNISKPSNTANVTTERKDILWSDSIQSGAKSWGFHLGCQHPISKVGVSCSDSHGANLSRVPDPAGGASSAIRHYIVPSDGGGRAQLSTTTSTNPAFADQVASSGEVWIEQEMFIPAPLPSSIGKGPWLSLMDFHTLGPNGADRWHTNPGLFLCSAALRCAPGDAGKLMARNWQNTIFAGPTANPVPVNQWFKLQVHFRWSTSAVPVTYYINGTQVLQITLPTKGSGHASLEWYSKLYGDALGGKWYPNPLIRYTRNVKISRAFIQ